MADKLSSICLHKNDEELGIFCLKPKMVLKDIVRRAEVQFVKNCENVYTTGRLYRIHWVTVPTSAAHTEALLPATALLLLADWQEQLDSRSSLQAFI
jgi:hypothetical protein